MIIGIGIDVIEISRIREMEERWGARFIERVFTEDEIAYCSAKSNRAESYAVRFAAKEAFAKALGTGWDGNFQWKDFSTRTISGGKPVALLSIAKQHRLLNTRIHLSLSHSDHFATAVVILEDVKQHDG